jgi:hypothetical protein
MKIAIAELQVYKAIKDKSNVYDLWKITAKYRLQSMKSAKNVPEIFLEWPQYKEDYGVDLVGKAIYINKQTNKALLHKINYIVKKYRHN